jgi:hypothetical protein
MDCGKPVHKDVVPARSKHVPPLDPVPEEFGLGHFVDPDTPKLALKNTMGAPPTPVEPELREAPPHLSMLPREA